MEQTAIYLIILIILINTISSLFACILIKGFHKHNKDSRDNLTNELREIRQELHDTLSSHRIELNTSLNHISTTLNDNLLKLFHGINQNAKDNRDEQTQTLKDFSLLFSNQIKEFNEIQRQKFETLTKQQAELIKATENRLETIRLTVDEKLHKTLDERLGQSFKLVSERLEAVQKGLGEMQNLACNVGDLKKVLGNIKTRGILGEIQLGSILEQILAPEQYTANAKPKEDSEEVVEYAVILPGTNENGQILLPIDAKFPQEDYIRLQEAYEKGDKNRINDSLKALIIAIKKNAKDIFSKYINPPHTTDFAIMFLPTEGLYAEIIRQPELLSLLQRDYKVVVTGPTTLAAILNSLQIGFKTLTIQKRSSEVWEILAAVKSEFNKFASVLEKTQQKLNEANKDLDTLVGTRTRMLISKLNKIESLPDGK